MQALLTRLEAKLLARSNITDISPLMKRLFPKAAKAGQHLERYPARVFLCAYMVLSHPKVVFNTQGELEDMLAAAGKTMIAAFEALLEQLALPMQAMDRWVPLKNKGPLQLPRCAEQFTKALEKSFQRLGCCCVCLLARP